MTEVKLVTDENDILFALMPDGTYRELLVDVPNAQNYGILGVGSPARADQIEGIERRARHERVLRELPQALQTVKV